MQSGLGLALAGDIVVAARNAKFLAPFVNIALAPDVGSSWILPRLIGPARARAMLMLGEAVTGEQAEDWGMIYKAVDGDKLLETAREIALRLANGPTVALTRMRHLVADGLETSLTDALAREAREQTIVGRTADHLEGVAAFLDKRKPDFQGL